MADCFLLPVPPAQEDGAEYQECRDQEEGRRNRLSEEHHRVSLADRQRPAEMLFSHRSQDQSDHAGMYAPSAPKCLIEVGAGVNRIMLADSQNQATSGS